MQSAAISTITKMAQMAQKHAGDLLQQPLLDMSSWAGLGCCCLPGNDCETSSGLVKVQVDCVHATVEQGNSGVMRRHDRCIGECKIGQCQHTFLHGHLCASRSVCTSQNRLGCLCLCDHYDPHYEVTERPRQGNVYCVTRVQGVYDEVQYNQVLITVSRALPAAMAGKIKHT